VTDLVLGPLLRYVDETSAAIWVETADPALVTVTAGGHTASARTFGVHGHHYALVCLEGLEKGSKYSYTVESDGEKVWPLSDTVYPDSVVPTLDHDKPLRIAFGSCRTSVTHDAAGHASHGVDALRAYALRMAGVTDGADPDDPDPGGDVRWPDLVLFLGDQVYADETTPEMWTFIDARRDIDEPPGTELRDYEEYAHLYRLAWTNPANRWLLSTVPTAMIFDDHDIRDDWNTSHQWQEDMRATSWWHDRIVGGLAAYWVYQHLGNLTPEERRRDELWRLIDDHEGEEELDLSDQLDALAERADEDPATYRWSYARDLGTQARLVVVDSRAARVLEPDARALLDDDELRWLDDQLRGDVDHLLIGTSLPFLLAPGLHYFEAFSEALAGGAWGDRFANAGERLRRAVDLEHWAAFQESFSRVSDMVLEVARGERGRAPATVTFLGGDVHHSYVSEATPARRAARGRPTVSRIIQAVCSPIRNPLSPRWRFITALSAYGVARPIGHLAAKSTKVPKAPLHWKLVKGPWFDNNLATLEITREGLRMWWAKGQVEGDAHHRPRLVTVSDVTIESRQPSHR
jgi:PhoD-like phosphatase